MSNADLRPVQTQNYESTLTPDNNTSRDKDQDPSEFDSMPSQSVLDRAVVPAMHVKKIKAVQTAERSTSTNRVSSNNDIIHTVPTA